MSPVETMPADPTGVPSADRSREATQVSPRSWASMVTALTMAALPESLQILGRGLLAQQLAWIEKSLVQAAQLHGWTLAKPTRAYALMLLSALEGSSFIDWALGPSADPLAAFNHILDTLG